MQSIPNFRYLVVRIAGKEDRIQLPTNQSFSWLIYQNALLGGYAELDDLTHPITNDFAV